MFCRQCGAKLPEDSKFCNVCGNKIINMNEVQAPQPAVQSQQAPAAVVKAADTGSEKRKKILIALLIIVVIAAVFVVVAYILDKNKKVPDKWPYDVRYGTIDEDGTLTVTKDYSTMYHWDVPNTISGETITVKKLVIGKAVTEYKFNQDALPDLEEISVEDGNNNFIAVDNVLYKKERGDALARRRKDQCHDTLSGRLLRRILR